MIKLDNMTDTMTAMVENILEPYIFTADEYVDENDGSVILWSNDFDTWASGKNKEEAVNQLAVEILEFSKDFYKEFDLWAKGRKTQIPYVLKALMLNDAEKIGGLITCRPGEI